MEHLFIINSLKRWQWSSRCWLKYDSSLTTGCYFLKILYSFNCVFHKYGRSNVGVTNFLSKTSMLFLTKENLKLADRNRIHDQGIGIILYYISCRTSLLLSRPYIKHHIIGWPQMSCQFSKGYIITSWIMWICESSRLVLDVWIFNTEKFGLYTYQGC